ncbi:MAG TPA: LpqB family beta-propeller domain-containing protein [Vicinamibacterales bacterium]|nr:LpqB family beta-propeller domain-containing protein [Vicinamibacterales bacterium]
MRNMRAVAAVTIACAAIMLPSPVSAQLSTQEGSRLRMVYFEGAESYLVPYAVRTFFNSLAFQRKLLGYEPDTDITVLLADFEDHGNAGVSVVPRSMMMVQVSPLSFAFETIAANERMNTIMNHELVHVATMDQASGRDRMFRRLFGGKVNAIAEHPETILYTYLTAPRAAAPRWFHEGIAVFIDTWMAGGLGRAQSGYDEMVFRSMVRDGARFYDPLGLVSEGVRVDFQLQINSYLYGTRFMMWLANTYGPAKLVEWVQRQEGSRGYYASQFEKIYGRSLENAWAAWVDWERAFQQKNLEAIRQYPTTPYRDVSRRALGSISRAYYDDKAGKLYAAFNYPGVVAHVGAIDVETGDLERIVDIKGPVIYTVTSLAYDPDEQLLFYTTDNGAHRDLVRVDPGTRKTELLMKDARIGDLAFNRADRTLWGIRHLNGIASVVRIAPPYKEWTRVYSFPYGTVVYDLDVSPDGTRLSASFGEIDGKQNVRVFSTEGLLAGNVTPEAAFDFGPSVPSGFVFTRDGQALVGSSYYTGVSNIFRYDIASKDVSALSNAETGFFRPVPRPDGRGLFVFRYSGEGFVAAEIDAVPLTDVSAITFFGERLVEAHPVLKTWMVGSPNDIRIEEKNLVKGNYKLAGGLRRESIYPVVQGYKDSAAVGVRANFSDPLQLNKLNLTAAYTPGGSLDSDERLHLRADYQRFDWRARATYNDASFYDLFGPTKTGRKGYTAGIGYHRTLLYDEPRRIELETDAMFAGNLDRLPQYQNVEIDVDRLFAFEGTLKGQHLRSSLGRVDDEKGMRWSATIDGTRVAGQWFGRTHGTLDLGAPLPLPHSSIWLRSAAGVSPGSREEPFANFFFGGFGNNWVDRGEAKRYRQYYAFPGAELNELGGRNFFKSTLEWNLPPLLFRRLGTPGLYFTWMRPAVFVGGLLTNVDHEAFRRRAVNAGGQLDFQLIALSSLDLMLSVGGAVALENGFAPRREFMVSFKVLR